MKKFLLSILAVTAMSFTAAAAESVTLDVNDAANIKGTVVEEEKKDDGTVKAAKHVQPLESFELGSYTFTFSKGEASTDPAYYWATSTNKNQDKTVRVYNGNTMTVAAPAGATMTSVKFVCAKGKANSVTAATGTLTQTSATEFTWTGSAASFTLTFAGTFQIRTVEFGEGSGTVTPDPDPTPGPDPDPTPDPTPGDGTTLDVNDATDIKGTVVEEEKKEDGSVKAAKHVQPLESFVLGGYTFTFSKGEASTDPAYYWATSTNQNQDKTVRVYNGNSMTMTAPAGTTMTSVKFVCAKGKANSVTAATGTLTQTSATEFTWTGSAASFTLTFAGTFQIRTIELGNGGDTPTPPDPTPGAPTEGPGSEDQPLTVTEAIAKANDGTINWVNGIIVGVYDYVEGQPSVLDSEAPFTTNSNLVIATSADATDYFAVQLPAGKLRDDLNLVSRPALIGREVSVCGKLQKYCGVNGMKETSDYSIVGGLPELPVEETESLTTFFEEQNETTNFKIKGDVTVYYQSPDKKYTFITDGTTSMEVYTGAGLANAYVNGDVLSGIVGKFGTYQNMPQLVPVVDSFGAATKGTPVEPAVKALADVKIAEYVQLDNVDIAEVTDEKGKTSYTISDGTTTKTLFNRFNITVAPATGVKVIGIGAIFGETQQIFPIQIGESSISEISADVKGEAAIYDLQGRKVAKAGKGLYIVNGKKVLF